MMEKEPTAHSLLEDTQAFSLSAALAGFALLIFAHLGFITGQTAGLAFVIAYATGWAFGPVFFVINLPFYALAWMRMGPRFTIKSFIAVTLVTLVSMTLPTHVSFAHLTEAIGAVLAGALAGIGLIVLFRHGGSLGGIGVLALYLQDKTGFRAGWTQLIFDAALFAVAYFVIGGSAMAYSLIGAVVTNLIIAVNHRPDRYTGR